MSVPHEGDDLADRLGRLILGREDSAILDPGQPADHLEIVRRAVEANGVARDLLQQAVSAARSSGHSWAAIGDVLGLTRQAAQQRFGAAGDADASAPGSASGEIGEERWLGPITAFDEMPELELAGRRGWHTIGAAMFKHRMVRTATQWEHRRVVWNRPTKSFEKDGWVLALRAFPWIYLIRDTGLPAED